jgi:4-amino-4-deoxy-L-arabinose transferase-like glycosyltransferase
VERFTKRWLTVSFALIAAVYALLVPTFELPDEPDHLAYVNFIAERGALPNQYDPAQAVLREGHQPPLYYALCALLVRLTQPDQRVDVRPVPHRSPDPAAPEDIPIFRHVDMPLFPTHADWAGFYLLRLLSVLLATLTVAIALRLFHRVLPSSPGWQPIPHLAAILLIGLPQFAFISGGITNDNLANLLGTLTLYGMVCLIESPHALRLHAWVGLLLGLGLLTKKSLLALLIGWLVLIAWLLWRGDGGRRGVAKGAAIAFLMMGVVSGWWLIRNLMLYGDLLGNEMERRTLPELVHEKSLFSRYFLASFWRVTLFSAIGIFGWMNVLLPLWVYTLGTGLLLLALIGLVRGWQGMPVGLRWCLIWVLLQVAGLVWYNLTYSQPQGRLLFPALSAGLALIAYGLAQWVPARRMHLGLLSLTLFAILLHLLSWWTLYAFYYPPSRYQLSLMGGIL